MYLYKNIQLKENPIEKKQLVLYFSLSYAPYRVIKYKFYRFLFKTLMYKTFCVFLTFKTRNIIYHKMSSKRFTT